MVLVVINMLFKSNKYFTIQLPEIVKGSLSILKYLILNDLYFLERFFKYATCIYKFIYTAMKTSILTAAILASSVVYATNIQQVSSNEAIYDYELLSDTTDTSRKGKGAKTSRDTSSRPILQPAPVPGRSNIPDPKYPVPNNPMDTVRVNPDATKDPNRQPVLPPPVPTPSQPNPPTSSPAPIQPGTPPQP